VNLVWFDPKLRDLMLPALPRPNYVNDADEKYYEPISVGRMAEKYFEWVGNVSAGEKTRTCVCAVLGCFVLNENSVVGEQSHLEVKVHGPRNAEVSWMWGGQE